MVTDHRDELLKKAVSLRRLIVSYTYGIVGSFELAEDVYQETIVVICNKFDEFKAGTNERAWIMEIARRTALGMVTKSYRKREHGMSDEALAALASDEQAHQDAEDVYKASQQQRSLEQCIKKLSPKARQLINERYVEQKSCDEIAEETKRSVNSIYVTLTRVRKALRNCVQKIIPDGIIE